MCAMFIEDDKACESENPFFEFERDFVSSLRCIPMIVRFKLDLCGIKLSLRAWGQFDRMTRAQLVGMPARSTHEIAEYGDVLCQAIERIGQQPVLLPMEPSPAWVDIQVPAIVLEKAKQLNVALERFDRWCELSPLQRFALVKLTRGGHENENFMPALREFGLSA